MGPALLVTFWISGVLALVVILSVLTTPSTLAPLLTSVLHQKDNDGAPEPALKNSAGLPQPIYNLPEVYNNETFARPCQGSPTSSSRLAYFLRVDQSGAGDFRTVQAAVNAAPENSERRTIIRIEAGIYEWVNRTQSLNLSLLVVYHKNPGEWLFKTKPAFTSELIELTISPSTCTLLIIKTQVNDYSNQSRHLRISY